MIGAKAYNLGVVRSLGFTAPEFVALPVDRARRDAAGSEDEGFLDGVLHQLHLGAHDKLAVRSSAVGEDGANGSLAGAYRSLLNVDQRRLSSALCEFLESNGQRNGDAAYRGSIIVQRMIAADYAGVCLTRDPRTGQGNAVIWNCGGRQRGRHGRRAVPDRLVVDRLTGDILEEDRHCAALAARRDRPGRLVQQFLTLEARFGQPLDIEWAVARPQAVYPPSAADCQAADPEHCPVGSVS